MKKFYVDFLDAKYGTFKNFYTNCLNTSYLYEIYNLKPITIF